MRYLFALAAILTGATSFAQKDVTNAYMLEKDGKYEEAAMAIDRAITNEKAMSKEKTWRYRGNIYTNLAADSALIMKYPDAIYKAIESYGKAMDIDARGSYKSEQTQGMIRAQYLANDYGSKFYGTGDYKRAAEMFNASVVAADKFNQIDTLGIWNTALCYEKAEMFPEAIDGYDKTAKLGYQVPNVYLFIANIQRTNMDDTDAALKTLAEARAAYPREQSLIIEELNIYIEQGDFDKAKNNLTIAAEQDPNNEVLWFSLGTISDNLGNQTEAEAAYVKALEVNPNYFDANYNLGAMYFNNGVEKVKLANDVPTNQNDKYKSLLAEASSEFERALPFLEKAHATNPGDLQTMRSLRDIYARIGLDEKLLEMSARIKEVEVK